MQARTAAIAQQAVGLDANRHVCFAALGWSIADVGEAAITAVRAVLPRGTTCPTGQGLHHRQAALAVGVDLRDHDRYDGTATGSRRDGGIGLGQAAQYHIGKACRRSMTDTNRGRHLRVHDATFGHTDGDVVKQTGVQWQVAIIGVQQVHDLGGEVRVALATSGHVVGRSQLRISALQVQMDVAILDGHLAAQAHRDATTKIIIKIIAILIDPVRNSPLYGLGPLRRVVHQADLGSLERFDTVLLYQLGHPPLTDRQRRKLRLQVTHDDIRHP